MKLETLLPALRLNKKEPLSILCAMIKPLNEENESCFHYLQQLKTNIAAEALYTRQKYQLEKELELLKSDLDFAIHPDIYVDIRTFKPYINNNAFTFHRKWNISITFP